MGQQLIGSTTLTPQPPQLSGSVKRLTISPLQHFSCTCGDVSAAFPQPPQFLSSVFVGVIKKVEVSGAPATTTAFGQQDVGFVALSGSAVSPQLKQLSFVPFAVGTPSQQRGVAPSSSHTTSQSPQFSTSSITSMHEPSQHFVPSPQATPQPVQSVSVPSSVHTSSQQS